jgi:hypothetical protein
MIKVPARTWGVAQYRNLGGSSSSLTCNPREDEISHLVLIITNYRGEVE